MHGIYKGNIRANPRADMSSTFAFSHIYFSVGHVLLTLDPRPAKQSLLFYLNVASDTQLYDTSGVKNVCHCMHVRLGLLCFLMSSSIKSSLTWPNPELGF